MSNHAKFSLAVVLIGSVLLAVGCRDDLTFHNPVDPDNPDSPFYEPVIATSAPPAARISARTAVFASMCIAIPITSPAKGCSASKSSRSGSQIGMCWRAHSIFRWPLSR